MMIAAGDLSAKADIEVRLPGNVAGGRLEDLFEEYAARIARLFVAVGDSGKLLALPAAVRATVIV
jgi:hypothetical protein